VAACDEQRDSIGRKRWSDCSGSAGGAAAGEALQAARRTYLRHHDAAQSPAAAAQGSHENGSVDSGGVTEHSVGHDDAGDGCSAARHNNAAACSGALHTLLGADLAAAGTRNMFWCRLLVPRSACFLTANSFFAALASNVLTCVISFSVTFRLAVIDIASGGWMTLSKRVLRALHAAHSPPPLLQLLVTNRCPPPAPPRCRVVVTSMSPRAATLPPLQPSSSSTTCNAFFILVSLSALPVLLFRRA
jgi:hypothetical protein